MTTTALPPRIDPQRELEIKGGETERKWRGLARELAMDIHEPVDILKRLNISEDEWHRISSNPVFKTMVSQEMEVWGSALNTKERIEVKTLTIIEDTLLEFSARLHDKNEPLSAKVELFKALQRGVGIGQKELVAGGQSERVRIVINMGADKQLEVSGELPPKVIDAQAVEVK